MTAAPARADSGAAGQSLDDLIERNAPLPTWFGVGGRADALATPHTLNQLIALLKAHAGEPVRILGDGANLLVDDDGVDGLVLSLANLSAIDWPDASAAAPGPTALHCQAGASLFRMIPEAVRRGLAGLEPLAGIPATLGGAIMMNAGGAFGQIADLIESVHALTYAGDPVTLHRSDIAFDYRHSGLRDLIITGATLSLRQVSPDEQPALRARFKEVMEYKKGSQPLSERSAGCFFRNPIVSGKRRSAGMLIDQAGCKGLSAGGASVSERHANFIVTRAGCAARDILALTGEVARRVHAHCGVTLEPEVVVWRRSCVP